LELSKICAKDEVVIKNVDFCKIMGSTNASDFEMGECLTKLCSDCCRKELKNPASQDDYFQHCNTQCNTNSKNMQNAKLSNAQEFQILDNSNEMKPSIKLEVNPIKENILKDLRMKVQKYENKLNNKLDVN